VVEGNEIKKNPLPKGRRRRPTTLSFTGNRNMPQTYTDIHLRRPRHPIMMSRVCKKMLARCTKGVIVTLSFSGNQPLAKRKAKELCLLPRRKRVLAKAVSMDGKKGEGGGFLWTESAQRVIAISTTRMLEEGRYGTFCTDRKK